MFYEQAGAIRDIFQNHLLQLVALTAMEPPIDFTADSVRNEKVKVLRSVHTPGPKHIVRGQYARLRRGRGGARLPRGARRRARFDDRDVRRGEALRRQLALGRHAFYVRAGKRSRGGRRRSRSSSSAPHPPFAEIAGEGLRPNVLLVHVQPDEGVSLAIGAKVPGAGMIIRTVHMDFLYGGAFRPACPRRTSG